MEVTKLVLELQAAKDEFESVSAGTVTMNDNLLVTYQVFVWCWYYGIKL